ncbi:hypothetical protein WCLP8_3240001 [uncultured Gammaproteobacteria bacterium]
MEHETSDFRRYLLLLANETVLDNLADLKDNVLKPVFYLSRNQQLTQGIVSFFCRNQSHGHQRGLDRFPSHDSHH